MFAGKVFNKPPVNRTGIPSMKINLLNGPPKIAKSPVFKREISNPLSGSFVFPEDMKLQPGEKREFYYDSLKICKDSEKLISEIKISDQNVSKFIEKILQNSKPNVDYHLLYHNRRVEGITKQEADAIACIYKYKKDGTTYIFPHRLSGSTITQFHLESIFLNRYPKVIVTWPSRVSLRKEFYGDFYKKEDIKELPLQEGEIKNIWPFPLSQKPPIMLKTKPPQKFSEKMKIFFGAIREDRVFGLKETSSFLYNAGNGILHGAVLYPILKLSQELKILAFLDLIVRFYPLFTSRINSQSAEEADRIEINENLLEKQNKKIPLWEMGSKYQTLKALLRRQMKLSVASVLSSILFFEIYPLVFKSLWGDIHGSLISTLTFVICYLLSEVLGIGATTIEELTSYKIERNRLDGTKFEKDFWTIHALHQNAKLYIEQISFGLGFGLYWLSGFNNLWGISLASVGLFLSFFKFLLPLFGEKQSNLTIWSTVFSRYGRYLKFPGDFRLLIIDEKVNLLEAGEGILIPDPSPEKVKIVLQEDDFDNLKIIRKKYWLWRILSFGFYKKQKIILRLRNNDSPLISLIKYGKEEINPINFIEITDFGFLKENKGEETDGANT